MQIVEKAAQVNQSYNLWLIIYSVYFMIRLDV